MEQQNNYNQPVNDSTPDFLGLEIVHLVRRSFKYWYIYAISIFIFASIGLFYVLSHNFQYRVTSSILVRDDASSGAAQQSLEMLQMLGMGGSKQVADEIEVLISRSVYDKVLQDMNIDTEYRVKKGLTWEGEYGNYTLQVEYPPMFVDTIAKKVHIKFYNKGDKYKFKLSFYDESKTYEFTDINQPVNTFIGPIRFYPGENFSKAKKIKMQTKPRAMWIEDFRKAIKVQQISRQTNVIGISTVSDMPERDIAFIQDMIVKYNEQTILDKNMLTATTKAFIEDRLEKVALELDSAESEVANYKKDNNINMISKQAEIAIEASTEYQRQFAAYETQKRLVRYVQDFVNDEKNAESLIPANIGINDEALVNMIAKYNGYMMQRMRLSRTASETNPLVVQLDKQIEATRSNIKSSIISVLDGLQILQDNVARQERLFGGKLSDAPQQEKEYVKIARQKELTQAMYMFLYKRREETVLQLASTMNPTRVIDQPRKLPKPEAPRRLVLLVLFALLGFVLVALALLIQDLFERKISSETLLKAYSKLPYLGSLKHTNKNMVAIAPATKTKEAEQIRKIRIMLQANANPERTVSKVLFTSINDDNASAYVAVNTAISFAMADKKTVLVELNLRQPIVNKELQLYAHHSLADYLEDNCSENEIIYKYETVPQLRVIPAVREIADPSEALQSKKINQLLAQLHSKFEVVVILAASLETPDAYLLSDKQGVDVCVVRKYYNTTQQIESLADSQSLLGNLNILMIE